MKKIFLLFFFSVSVLAAPPKRSVLLEEYIKARDPFKMPQLKKIFEGSKNELEKFSSDSFKMVGIVTGPDHLRAILIDPEGKTHIVSEKMKLGTRGGFIKYISTESILVREKVLNVLGEEEYFETELKLQDLKTEKVGAS